MNAYRDALSKVREKKNVARWQLQTDIDEWVASPFLSYKGWLRDTLQWIEDSGDGVGAVFLTNIGFLGYPNWNENLVIDRLYNATRVAMTNQHVKPINYLNAVGSLSVHRTIIRTGYHPFEPGRETLYMAHYWGARLQGFQPGPLSPDLAKKVEPNYDMMPMAKNLKVCRDKCSRAWFHWGDKVYWDVENTHSNAPKKYWQ